MNRIKNKKFFSHSNKRSWNRKGQMGKIISSFPVMISVFVIMGLFIVGTFFISNIKGVEDNWRNAHVEISSPVEGMELSYREIEIDGKKMSVFDAIIETLNRRISREDFNRNIKTLVGDKACFFIAGERTVIGDYEHLFFVQNVIGDYGKGDYTLTDNIDYYAGPLKGENVLHSVKGIKYFSQRLGGEGLLNIHIYYKEDGVNC